MEDLATFWGVLMGILAAIIAFGGAGAVIAKVFSVPLKVQEQVTSHESAINDIKSVNNMELKCLLHLMNHAIDGNHVDQMKLARDELQDFLISR